MNLEEGIFFRTKSGTINKIDSLTDDKSEVYFDPEPLVSGSKCLGYRTCYTKDIVKTSHNIIDLIEVGDYVNGFKIIRRFVNIHNGKKLLIALEKEEGYEYSNNLNDYRGDDSIHIYDEDIKTIVTSQQFESMQYEVK